MSFNNPQIGLFSKGDNLPVDQEFFDAAFAGRISGDPIYREAYNCDITGMCNVSTWLDEYMGYDTDCYPAYDLIETDSVNEQIKVKTLTTIPVNPATGTIALDTASHYVSGAYILPQVGNTLVSPNGVLMEVTAISTPINGDAVLTVVIRDVNAAAQTLNVGDVLLVLSGSFLGDCEAPTGQFAFQDLPIVQQLQMVTVGDHGELCGDALLKCQYLKIPFTDENGNVYEKWYTQALQDMYRRFEVKKYMERLLNPNFGIIPVLKARGQNFATASATEIVEEDIQGWKTDLQTAGINCFEYAVFAGRERYAQWQTLLRTLGGTATQNVISPTADCKWINLEYCGIRVGGMTFHVYEDCSFGNGKMLGGAGSGFPNAMIFIPLCSRTSNLRSGDNKMFTTVYFKDNTGRVWDNLTDSNGIFGTRNTFQAGLDKQEWSIKARFVQEVHCAKAWGFTSLP